MHRNVIPFVFAALTELTTEPIVGTTTVVIAVAIALLVLVLLLPPPKSLTRGRYWALTALRIAVILLLLIAMLRPTWQHTHQTPRRGVAIIMADGSRSMLLPSGTSSTSRYDAQLAALQASSDALARLMQTTDLKFYQYDKTLQQIEVDTAGRVKLAAAPTGSETDLGTTLSQAIRTEQGKRVAAVFLLGDGVQTAFDPQVESQEAARQLRDDFAAPLYAVTIGPVGDAATSKDVAVQRLDEQFTVFVKTELVVKSLLRMRGYVGRDIPVRLTLFDAQNRQQVIGEKMVRQPAEGSQVEVEFSYVPQVAGNYRLQVSMPTQPGELVTSNNMLDAYLTVREGGLRVLYLDGDKRFEQKFLRRALNSSPDIELDDRIIDRRARSRWPIELPQDFQDGKYDAIILGDIDASALGEKNLATIATMVEQGKGLLMIGGRSSFGPGHYLGTPLADVLPIKIDRLEGADFGGQERDQFFIAGPIEARPAADHPVVRISPASDLATAWEPLPPLAWANRFVGVKPIPGVRVLLETARGEPLLVSGEYGRGRVLAFAGESTYRWQMHGFEQQHKRFWRQVILWLVRRDDLARDEVWVRLDQRRLAPGGKLRIEAGARTAAGDPIPDAKLDVVLVRPDGKRQPITLSSDRKLQSGQVQLVESGSYAVEVAASQNGKPLGNSRAELLVVDRDVELSIAAADPAAMDALAAWTRDAGGRSLALEELPAMLDELSQRPQEVEERIEREQLGGSPSTAWPMLLLLVSLMGSEWFLRKKWGLV